MMSTPEARYHTKNRIVAVDIVRLMAAFAVMYEHVAGGFAGGGPITKAIPDCINGIFSALSPLFFLLAGYFASRNITWKKALDNSWWSFAPFILWNIICIAVYAFFSALPKDYNIFTLFGLNAFFSNDWCLFPELSSASYPTNGPLWFMRDLILLFLLTPFLAKCARVVFPACVIASMIPAVAPMFDAHINSAFLAPRSLAFFAAGCFLQTFSKEQQKKALSYYSPIIIIGYIVLSTTDFFVFRFIRNIEELALCKSLLAIWVFYQIARWTEVKLPCISPWALKYAPVTFLTFAAHMPLFLTFRTALQHFCPPLQHTEIVLLAPIISFILLAFFFFALKRHAPSLLHLVAHYKLRPDDLLPKGNKVAVTQTSSTP